MTKRKIISIIVTLILILSMGQMLACSRVDPGTVDRVVGTYELTKYEKTYVNGEEKPEEDLLKDRQIKMYLVLTMPKTEKNADNTLTAIGYLYYRDKETPAFCKEVKITYNLSFNQEDLIDEVQTVSYTTEYGEYGARNLVTGWRSLGYLDKKQALNVDEPFPNAFKKEYREYVYMKKVSKATDTSYIEEEVGSVNVEKYLKSQLGNYYLYSDSIYDLNQDDYKKYIYVYMELSEDRKTATRYYATKEELVARVEENLPVTYTESQDGTMYIKAKIGEIEYQVAGSQLIMITSGDSAPVFETFDVAKTESELDTLIENYKTQIELQNS